MLRKKIQKEDSKVVNSNPRKIALKKSLSPLNVDDTQSFPEDTNSNNVLDIGNWLIANVFSEEVINNLKNNLYVSVPHTDINSTPSRWLNMFIKSYLSQDDIYKVINTITKYKNISNKYKDSYEESLIEKENLEKENKSLIESLDLEKNKVFRVKKRLEQMVNLSKFIEYSFENVKDSDNIQMLLNDALNGDSDNLDEFIIPFSIHCQNILLLRKYIRNDLELDIELYLDEIKILLASISNQYIPQRKKLLEELAIIISKIFSDVKFVSPEEYTFIDPSIHNIPNSGGQKVIEGISFAVVKNETGQTIIYADIVAE